jgi:hypothetical protein
MPRYIRRKGGKLIASKSTFIMWQMPYGCYHCADGREVLFDRDYAPMCQRHPGQAPTLANPKEWVKYARQEWFYDDGTPQRERVRIQTAKLREWGMLETVTEQINQLMSVSRSYARQFRG